MCIRDRYEVSAHRCHSGNGYHGRSVTDGQDRHNTEAVSYTHLDVYKRQFLWNVNSFDQEGVQLGKVLAKRVLAHETDGALKVFSDLLNI